MSQTVDISVVVQGIAALLQAVAEAGAQIRAERKLRASDGTTHEVDYVATDATGAELGVKVDRKTEQVTFVPADCEAGKAKALAGRIAQRYAYARITQELERKGYSLSREEKQRDGSLKLVMTRWR